MPDILTREEILKRMDKPIGKDLLFISPLMDIAQIRDTAVDLRLGQHFLLQKPSRLSVLDVIELSKHKFSESLLEGGYSVIYVPYGEFFTLHAGQTIRIGSLEYIGMPTNLQGEVTPRHSVSSVPIMFDVAKIQPGYRGVVVLTLKNNGLTPVYLYPGMRIAQMSIQTLPGKISSPSKSRYSHSVLPEPVKIHLDDEIKYLGPIVEPLIIGIVSTISSGRSTALKYLTRTHGFVVFSLVTFLRQKAYDEGIDYKRPALQTFGSKLRELHGDAYLAEQLRLSRHWIENKNPYVIVDSLKNLEEVKEFRKQKRFYLVGIDAPVDRRRTWDNARKEIGARPDSDDFQEINKIDKGTGEENSHGQQVDYILKNEVDEMIYNDGSKDDFYMKLDNMIRNAKRRLR